MSSRTLIAKHWIRNFWQPCNTRPRHRGGEYSWSRTCRGPIRGLSLAHGCAIAWIAAHLEVRLCSTKWHLRAGIQALKACQRMRCSAQRCWSKADASRMLSLLRNRASRRHQGRIFWGCRPRSMAHSEEVCLEIWVAAKPNHLPLKDLTHWAGYRKMIGCRIVP